MSRPAKKYSLWLNKQTGIFYFKLPGGAWRTTGFKTKTAAENFALDRWREGKVTQAKPRARGTLGDYVEPFFDWQRCPRIARMKAEGKRISPQHAKLQRAILKKYLLPDELMKLLMRQVKRADILAFRDRMMANHTPRVVNSIMTVLRSILREAVFREELDRDPSLGVGNISYKKRESGIFTEDELRVLFADPPGPWGDLACYTAFLTCATTGLRRGEILALRWRYVDLEAGVISVEEAWKDARTIGEPKWGQRRSVPLPAVTVGALRNLRRSSEHVLPDALVLCTGSGNRLGTTWWSKRFRAAMQKGRIKTADRHLTGHSFRHTLATLQRAGGIPDTHIRAAMGWSNPATQDDYTHLRAEHLRGQADIIDKLFR